MIKIKEGAKLNGLQPQMVIALVVASAVYSSYNVDCVLTEGTGGKHGRGSLHYIGNAIDLRTRDLGVSVRSRVADEIREALGEQYDVVLESDHIHIEFQPK